nr:putative Gag-polypeptide of LTR copia-type [Tanacetum cinerariifolium]
MYVYGYTDEDEFVPDMPTLINKLDISDPLHLHPNDSASLTVFSLKLKGSEKYQVWSCAMLLALEAYLVIKCEGNLMRMYVYGYTDEDEFVPDMPTLINKLDISDPLHLHPNDSASLTVFSLKLKGSEKYQVWSCAMLLALEGKNKTGFIDGSCISSNTDEVLRRQWDRVNVVVLGWILNSILEELFLGQIISKRERHVWEELKETYDKVDGSVTFSLHHKIHTLSKNGSFIADYYHKLNALWKQFDGLVELPRSTCHAADGFF